MSDSTTPSLDEFLRVVDAATERNTLRWHITADENTFRAEFSHGVVRITEQTCVERFCLSFIDRDGVLLGQYRPAGEHELIAIQTVYKKIRRRVLDIDTKIKNCYDQLKKLAGES